MSQSDQNYKAFEEDDVFGSNSKSKKRMSGGTQYELTAKALITLTFLIALIAPMVNELSYFRYAGPDISTKPILPVQCDGKCGFFNFKYCDDSYSGTYNCKIHEFKDTSIYDSSFKTSCNTNFNPFNDINERVMPKKQTGTNAVVFLFTFIAIIILFIVTLFAWIPFKCCNCIKRLLFIFIIIAGVLQLIAIIAFVIGSGKGTKSFCMNNNYTIEFVADGVGDAIAWKIGTTTAMIIVSMILAFISAVVAWMYLVPKDDNRKKDDDDNL